MNPFRNFMLGRYGTDQLTLALLILGIIFTFIGDALDIIILTLLSYIIFGACAFRMLSRNTSVRQSENIKFLKFWNPIDAWLKVKFSEIKNIKNYKYFKCPNCKQSLRVPRGKGKIAITCKKCNTKFIKNS